MEKPDVFRVGEIIPLRVARVASRGDWELHRGRACSTLTTEVLEGPISFRPNGHHDTCPWVQGNPETVVQ